MATNNANQLENTTAKSNNSQTIFIADLISEGPIEGLVDGEASVYLNNTRLMEKGDATYTSKQKNSTIAFSGTKTGTVSPAWTSAPSLPEDSTKRYLKLTNVASISGITATFYSSQTDSRAVVGIDLEKGAETFAAVQTTASNNLKVARMTNDDDTLIDNTTISGMVSGDKFYANANNLRNITLPATVKITLDQAYPIESLSQAPAQVVVSGANTPPTGTYEFEITSKDNIRNARGFSTEGIPGKYDEVSVQFRNGELYQKPLSEVGGVGNVSIAGDVSGVTLNQWSGTSYPTDGYSPGNSADGTVVTIDAGGGGFGLSAAQIREVDELRILISYGSLVAISEESGNEGVHAALYEYSIDITYGGVTNTFPLFGSDVNPVVHKGNTKSPIAFEHSINLEQFGPRDDFSVSITRLTRHEGVGVNPNGKNKSSRYKQSSTAVISNVVSIIKEKFSYPYTAYAGITFSSKDFDSVPQRTYHCRGMQVLVPSNYKTREEEEDGIAKYNGLWDGNLNRRAYTDNPAWVFYDMLVNNRYGVGKMLDAAEIDKYALYRIARYCDELVDDGTQTGGLEPRFRANLYFTKSADVYKVMKDMATVFMGMLYWMDGQISPTIDQPADPVYSFSKANVIDGKFNYESSGTRTRANQVVVSWNNPEANYELQPLIVEDRDAIVEEGRIISQNAVAFGATSEGQAIRFGRWKLWTAQNQTELVSFQTSLNAAYIKAGDIINVQDNDKYARQMGGKLSSANTSTTTSIYLDREITLSAGYTYTISCLMSTSSTTLAQDTATIGTVVYNKGDIIATGQTEDQASTILDDSDDLVATSFNEKTFAESQDITNGAGTYSNVTTLAFTQAPTPGSIWVLTETEATSGGTVAGSSKEFKVLSIIESSKNIYDIVGVEHYNVKYDAVDKDYSLGDVPDLLFPPKGDVVPAPKNVYVLTDSKWRRTGEELTLQWDAPDDYRFVGSYEIHHDLPEIESPIRVGKEVRSFDFNKVQDGTHRFGVRTIATDGDRSGYSFISVDVSDDFRAQVPRLAMGVAKGAYSTTNIFVKHEDGVIDNVLTFEDDAYALSPIQNTGIVYTSNVSAAPTYELSVDNIGVQAYANPTPLLHFLTSYFIYFDADIAMDGDNTDTPYRVLQWSFLELKDLFFWRDFNQSTFNNLTGTVNVAINDNEVIGTGTLFTTELEVGDIIKLSTENQSYFGSPVGDYGAKGAKVVAIIDNEKLIIDRSFDTAVTGYNPKTTNLQIDFDEDCIIANVWKPNGFVEGDHVQFNSFLTMKPSLVKTFYQDDAPLPASRYNLRTGDLWYDTDDGNKMHRWDGSSWLSAADSRQERTLQCFFLDVAPTTAHAEVDVINNGDFWYDITAGPKAGAHKRIGGAWVAIEYNALGRSLAGGYFWDSIANIQDTGHADYKPKFVTFWTSSQPSDANVPGGGNLEDYDIWYEYADTNVSAWKWDDTANEWVSFKSQGDLSIKDKVEPADVADDFYLADELIVNNTASPGHADFKVTAGEAYLGGTAHTITSEITGDDFVDSVEDGNYQSYVWNLYDENLSNLNRRGSNITTGDVTFSGDVITAINPTSFNTVAYTNPGQVVVTIIGGGGSGATAEPVFGGAPGMVTSINVTNGGSGYDNTKIPYIIMGEKIPTARSLLWSNLWSENSSFFALPRSTKLRLDGDFTGGIHDRPLFQPDTNLRDTFYFIGDSITSPDGTEEVFGPVSWVPPDNSGTPIKSWAHMLIDNGIVNSASVVDANAGDTLANYTANTVSATGSKVINIAVASGGSGYASAPTVNFSGGTPSVAATADAIVEGGSVVRIEITQWGTGYNSTPTVTLSGGSPTVAATVGTVSMNDGLFEFTDPGVAGAYGRHKIVVALGTNDTGSRGLAPAMFETVVERIIQHMHDNNYEVALVLPYLTATSVASETEPYRQAMRDAAATKGVTQIWEIPMVSHTRGEWESAGGGVHLSQGGQNMLYREFYYCLNNWSSLKPTGNTSLTIGYDVDTQEDKWLFAHALGAGFIQDKSAGARTDDLLISWQSGNEVSSNSYVVLHHNNVNRLQTTADGILINDRVTAPTHYVNGGNFLNSTGLAASGIILEPDQAASGPVFDVLNIGGVDTVRFNVNEHDIHFLFATDATYSISMVDGFLSIPRAPTAGTHAANKDYVDNNGGYVDGDTIKAASGSAATPGLTFNADTNTGLYYAVDVTDHLYMSVNGVKEFEIDSDGAIFAGYIAATDLSGYSASHTFICENGFGRFVDSGLNAASFATSGHLHSIDELSDVVEGTPSTNDVLTYNGSNWVSQAAAAGGYGDGDTIKAASGSAATPGLTFNADTNTGLYYAVDVTDHLYMSVNGVKEFEIDSDGAIFAGYIAATDLSGYSASHTFICENGFGRFVDSGLNAASFADASHNHAAGDVTSGTFAIARIPTGTTSSTVSLGNHNHNNTQVIASDGSAGSPGVRFNGNTDTGFYYNGGHIDVSIDSSQEFRFGSGGSFHADGNVIAYSTTTTSDPKLKNFVGTIPKAKDKLDLISGWEWHWKRDHTYSAGVRADEIAKVLPGLVSVTEDLKTGIDIKTVNYNGLIGLLVQALKEEIERNDSLEERLQRLEAMI